MEFLRRKVKLLLASPEEEVTITTKNVFSLSHKCQILIDNNISPYRQKLPANTEYVSVRSIFMNYDIYDPGKISYGSSCNGGYMEEYYSDILLFNPNNNKLVSIDVTSTFDPKEKNAWFTIKKSHIINHLTIKDFLEETDGDFDKLPIIYQYGILFDYLKDAHEIKHRVDVDVVTISCHNERDHKGYYVIDDYIPGYVLIQTFAFRNMYLINVDDYKSNDNVYDIIIGDYEYIEWNESKNGNCIDQSCCHLSYYDFMECEKCDCCFCDIKNMPDEIKEFYSVRSRLGILFD